MVCLFCKKSGGIPEYCESFGVEFDEDFTEKLKEIIRDYDHYKNKIKNIHLIQTKCVKIFYII